MQALLALAWDLVCEAKILKSRMKIVKNSKMLKSIGKQKVNLLLKKRLKS